MKLLRITLFAAAAALCAVASAQTNQVISGTPIPQATPGQPGIPVGATIPYVVSSKPSNGQRNVPWSTTKIEITFNEPMDVATFYWPLPQSADFPYVEKDPYWTNGNRTIVLPVKLNPTRVYRIPLNTSGQEFRSSKGVAANAGVISFETGQSSYGGTASKSAVTGNRPFQNLTPTPPPGGSSPGSSSSSGSGTFGVPSGARRTPAPSSGGTAGSGGWATGTQSGSGTGNQTGGGSQVGTAGSSMQDKIKRAQQLRQNRGGKPTPTPTPASGENQ